MSGLSSWTSVPVPLIGAILTATLMLAGCTQQAMVTRAGEQKAEALSSLPVLGDAVVITGPHGYCIDRDDSHSSNKSAFVLLASCRAVLERADVPHPRAAGLLTANVDDDEVTFAMPDQGILKAFFESKAGRKALSRSGNPDSVTITNTFMRGGTFYLRATEHDPNGVLTGDTWRAVFIANGRMVNATLRDLARSPIDQQSGFRLIETFARGIRRSSMKPA